MNVLGKGLRKYVMNEKKGYDKARQRVYDPRLEKTAIQGLKDLALLAEKLPEEQLAKIFNAENTSPFLRALLSLKSDSPEKRRKRVLRLWNTLFGVVSTTYGLSLVSREVWAVLASQPIPHIQAVYYATFFQEK